jgi:hypothetical protein
MLGLWKARRGRKEAGVMITPFVDQTRQRLGGIPESVWREPYVLGFLGMLITLVATRDIGKLHATALASVQAGAWADITGSDGALVGEEICFLSVAGDQRFDLGCRNARAFFEALGACPSIRDHRFRREFDSEKAAIKSRTFHCGYRSEHR